jgi:phage terminase small subunit
MADAINITSDRIDHGVPLRERYERFCGHFVESRNPMQAFRLSFVVDKTTTSQWVHEQAQKLLADPSVAARVQEMRDTAAAQTIVSVRELMQDWHDIATADPNEIVSHVREACRFCYGVDHRYQWKNELEYAEACDQALREKAPVMPDMSGGFGYRPDVEPVLTCPCCFGRGEGRTLIHDTTKLSGPARKLYAGVKETRSGVEVQLHDQQKARESLARILGAFKDGGLPVTPATPVSVPITPAMKEQDAGRAYLRLVGGGG